MGNLNQDAKPSLDVTDVSDKKEGYRNTRGPIRLGFWVLAIGFGGFLLWAALAPLDEGVPAMGMVAIDTKRKAIQHLSGGIVREVYVKEGQRVKEGELLISLNDANTRAAFEATRQQYFMTRATEGRLMAEKNGLPTIVFHPDLLKSQNDAFVQVHLKNQQSLLQSRRAAHNAELAAIEQTVQGLRAQQKGYQEQLVQRRLQLKLLQDELGNIGSLVEEGYVPRSRKWELERSIADSTGVIADLNANNARADMSILEAEQRSVQRRQEYMKEVETQLAEVMRTVDADAQKFAALKAELERTDIRSPVDGQVIGLSVQTVGGVVQAGQKLMDIVPGNESLILEIKIAPHLIDKVREGLPADIRFSTFAHSPQLMIEGKIQSISRDLLTEPQPTAAGNPSYYLARVVVTPAGMKKLGDRQLQAGMPAEVVIKTGERSLLTYLLHPLMKRVSSSMKEE
jgi:protease secretion system membrane fusion protein